MSHALRIEPARGKGRSFQVTLLHYVLANGAWEGSTTSERDLHRPVYLAYAGTEQEVRAFTANLRSARKAQASGPDILSGTKVQIPRRSGHRFAFRKTGAGVVVTAYLPALFELEATVLDERVSFIFAPASWWVAEQARRLDLDLSLEERREVVVAGLFAAYLDRRTPAAILADWRFHLQLLRAAREQSWMVPPSGDGFEVRAVRLIPGGAPRGLEEIAYVNVKHPPFEGFLREQIQIYRREHGPFRIRRPRRVLPDASRDPHQLGLFGEVGA